MFIILILILLQLFVVILSQDINPRVFLVNHHVYLYPTMQESPSTSQSKTSLKKGALIIGYQPPHMRETSWIGVVYPYDGYILNLYDGDHTLLELNSDIGACPTSSQYIQSHRVLMTCGYSRGWLHQWPIGNGMSGALTGGSLAQEVIPLSISDLYISSRDDLEDAYKMSSSMKSSIHNHTSLPKYERFQAARHELNKGNFQATYEHMDALRGGSVGRFEYIADISLIYLLPKSYGKTIETSPDVPRHPGPIVYNLQGRAGKNAVLDHGGREDLLRITAIPLRKIVELEQKYRLDMANDPSNTPIALSKHISTLHMTEGVATSTWIVPIPTSSPDGGVYVTPILGFDLHMRQWIASEVDDVIIGNISCIQYRRSSSNDIKKSKPGCLNLLWRFSRDLTGRSPEIEYDMTTSRDVLFDDQLVTQHRVGMKLVTNIAQFIAPTYTCMAIHCFAASNSSRHSGGNFGSSSASGYCLDSEHAIIISHTEKQDSLEFLADLEAGPFQSISKHHRSSASFASGRLQHKYLARKNMNPNHMMMNDTHNNNNIPDNRNYMNLKHEVALKLRDRCWQVVDAAVKKGSHAIYDDHIKLFQQRMSRVHVDIHGIDAYNNAIKSQPVESYVHVNPGDDARDIAGMYEMGRYLMLSSATRSPANLQGLWAEGKKSMWNGDYHLNINMQMMYWAADASGLDETLPPLYTFIDKLSKRGSIAAKNLYNCRGWVAHGFTDHFLDGSMQGELHWSLCVSCGAWLALSLWDHITYKVDLTILIEKILPTFYDTASFFMDYFMVSSDGKFLYTGPTTSPETSYSTVAGVANLALTPALDASVLRQTANAYHLAVELIIKLDPSARYMSISSVQTHQQQAQLFLSSIHKLPFDALPVLGMKSSSILEFPLPMEGALTTVQAIKQLQESKLKNQGNRFSYDNYNPSKPENKVDNKPASTTAVIDISNPKFLATLIDNKNKHLFVQEFFDPGHRHFSLLHWFYPGLFLPGSSQLNHSQANMNLNADSSNVAYENLYEAVMITLNIKMKSDTGHSSWSAAWLSCLWARLGSATSEQAWNALLSIRKKYMSKMMLSLHPPLQRIEYVSQGNCATCFHEGISDQEGKMFANSARALTTSDGSAFQLDGNAGLIASVNEMLIQSHIPGYLCLLPSLPTSLAIPGGKVMNMRARGGIELSFAWTGQVAKPVDSKMKFVKNELVVADKLMSGKIYAVRFMISAYHPWFATPDTSSLASSISAVGGMIETSPGYFTWAKSSTMIETIMLVLPYSDKPLQLISSSPSTSTSVLSKLRSDKQRKVHMNMKKETNQCAGILPRQQSSSSSSWTSKPYHVHAYSDRIDNSKKRPDNIISSRNSTADTTTRRTEMLIQISSYPCEIWLCWNFHQMNIDGNAGQNNEARCKSILS